MSDGALLELASRGKQDSYFIQGASRSWFGTDYERRSAATRQVREQRPENQVRFGKWIDIELPRASDILVTTQIRIQMHSWLPAEVEVLNRTHLVEIESQTPGVWAQYGWTNGIANYLIKRWALFADNLQITEGTGEFNSWYPEIGTTQLHAPLIHKYTGTHDGSNKNIQWMATPQELVFRLPLIGCQEDRDVGLPICAIKGQRLYLRLWLRDLKDLVESTDLCGGMAPLPLYETNPAPWNRKRIRINGVISNYVTLLAHEIKPPVIYGKYDVLNVDAELRDALRARPLQIQFREQRQEYFNIADQQWTPSARFKHNVEINGFFQMMFLTLMSQARNAQNKYRDVNPPGGGDWLESMTLNVNGYNRYETLLPRKFTELASNVQLPRDIEMNVYYLIFGYAPDGEPAGVLNISRTHKTTMVLQLKDTPQDPADPSHTTFAALYGLTWNVLDIAGDYCQVRFPQ